MIWSFFEELNKWFEIETVCVPWLDLFLMELYSNVCVCVITACDSNVEYC